MKLEGSLDAFSLPDVFALLSMTKKTGALHVRRGDEHGVLYFGDGALTGGTAAVGKHVLARRAVGAAAVEEGTLVAAIDRVRGAGGQGLAAALVEVGAVEEAVLHEVAAAHLVDVVFDLLRWPDGEFAFALDEADPDHVGLSVPAQDVVEQASTRLDEWSRREDLPAPEAVLTVAVAPAADPQLSREEWSFLALVDGARTVAEIVALSGAGEYAVVSALGALVQRGLLRAAGDDGVAAVVRRQALIAQLEDAPTATPPVPPTQGPAAPVPPAAPPVPAPRPTPPVVTAMHGSVEGSAAMAPATAPVPEVSPAIETDPSVNRSLLLRLIAGVRSL